MTTSQLARILVAVSAVAAAQTPATPTAPHATTRAPHPVSDSQLYRNTTFGFRYKIPYGWVDRTKEMRTQARAAAPDSQGEPAPNSSSSASGPTSRNDLGSHAVPSKDRKAPQADVLLAVFERPPEVPGISVNSAVVIASEPLSSYPGLKKAEEYLGPLTELATAKGFTSDGDPDVIEVDSRQLIRADFVKPLGMTQDNEKLAMHQSTLILQARGQIISFTFIAAGEEEVEDLMEGLHFAAVKPPSH